MSARTQKIVVRTLAALLVIGILATIIIPAIFAW